MLRSQIAGILVVPRVSKSSVWGRVFSYQTQVCWNSSQLDPGARPGVSVYRNALSFAAIGLGVCLPAPLSLSPLPLPLQIIYLSIH